MSNTPETNQPRPTSNTLHNENCRDYLMYLLAAAPDFLYEELDKAAPTLPLGSYLQSIKRNGFPETLPYGNMYYALIPFLEDHLEVLQEREDKDENTALHEFIYRLFANANKNLQRTYQAIKPVIAAPSNRPLETRITAHLANDGARINERDPILAGSMLELGLAAMSDDYRPMRDNIPSILPFNHDVLQLRFGTMAQKKDGDFRVSPLFQRWLKVVTGRHLYINHLAWDRPGFDPEGDREIAMSMALHGNPNLDVITLPADKGLMGGHEYTRTAAKLSREGVFNDLLDIADNTKNPALDRKYPIRDLNIPPYLSEPIFGDDRRGKLEELLKQSFRECGLADSENISCAQRQAVWVYFIDFALTNHIIRQLNPASVNISCKDAIDRGGLASAVFNLMYSVKSGNTPLTREQFEMLVDAPATMVKGRGMNNHRNRLWNMLDVWVNANFNRLDSEPKQRWIIAWRDDNCPSARIADVLDKRLTMANAQVQYMPPSSEKDALNRVITQVNGLASKGISDRRLLLRVISGSFALVQGADKEARDNYEKLIDRITIDSRLAAAGRLLSGAMKTLLGVVSFSSQRIQKGMGTFRSGFYFEERRAMTEELRRIKNESRPSEPRHTEAGTSGNQGLPFEDEDNDDSSDDSSDDDHLHP